MKIGSCVSRRGRLEEGFIRIAFKGKTAKLPIKIIEGKESGKVAFISAGMHGDELNGINIVSNFLNRIKANNLNGTLIIAPILNPTGFHYGERRVVYDDTDLNRCFGIKKESFSYKLANTFLNEVVTKSDFGLDFHDSNKSYILLPHTRVFEKEYKEATELSRIFGTEIVMKRKVKRGMLAYEARKLLKVPVLTVEIGGGMSLLPSYADEGIRGLNNVLVHKGFIKGNVVLPENQFILSEREGYDSSIEGILTIKRKLGEVIEKKREVAEVFSPITEKRIGINAKNPGVLFSIKAQAHIKANERAFSMLHFKEEGGMIKPAEGKMILNKESDEVYISEFGAINKAIGMMRKHSKDFFEALLKE